MKIPLSSPDIGLPEIAAVVEVLRTPTLSIGPKIEEFEASVARLVGVPHAIGVSSGTAGLHLCLRALGISDGDEVILPSFTFVAVGNAVLYERAVPVFVDIDPVTFNLDPAKIEERITPKTRCIIVVHTFGCPADLAPIMKVARRHGLAVIEDACEAIGAPRVGSAGDLAVFGFYPNKQITTGEGGMVVTRDAALAETIRALRNHGRRPEGDQLLGYNYRLSEIASALGVAQMKRLPAILERRASVAARYSRQLQEIPEVNTPAPRSSWFVYTVCLAERDAVWSEMTAQDIGCGRYFAPLHKQPLFAKFADIDLPLTEQVAARTLQLPFFNNLTDEQIAEVCSALRAACQRRRST